MIKYNDINLKQRKYLKKTAVLATFGSLLFGYDSGVINGSLSFMKSKDQLNLTPTLEGFVVGAIQFGAAIGAVTGGYFSDKFGRKFMLKVAAMIFFFATIGCALSPNAYVLITCRFVLGLAVGGAATIVPTFLAELAPKKVRGSLVSQDQLMIVTGQLLAYTFNAILGNVFNYSGIWRYMIALATIPAVVLWLGTLVMPETPRWLAANGMVAKALEVLRATREDQEAQAEIAEIQKNIEAEKSLDRATFKDLGVPWIRRLVFIGIAIAVLQHVAGINVIMNYGTSILEKSGLGVRVALIANISNGVIAVAGSWVYMHFIANKYHRRPILIIGYCLTTAGMLGMALVTHFFAGTALLPYLVIALTMIYLAAFQTTAGPLTWLILSEIFPLRVRGLGYGLSAFCNFSAASCVGVVFPILTSTFGLSPSFFIFAVGGVICIVVSYLLMPETFGKSLEELEEGFRNYKKERAVMK